MNRVLARDGVTYDGPNLVVCEGYSDTQFLKHLLNSRGIEPFELGCPTQDQEGVSAGGRPGMAEYLTAVRVSRTKARNGLTSLVVVVDADENPKASIAEARGWLESAKLPVPGAPFAWTTDEPHTAILLIPGWGSDGELRSGTLEHLLWDSLSDVSPETYQCVEGFAECLGNQGDWSDNKRAKMRVHATIAGRCKSDPASALSRVWSNDPEIFPLDHSVFDFICDLFRYPITLDRH